jgi:hypothetical protein
LEDDRLFHAIEPFLHRLPEPHDELVLRELASAITELRDAALRNQLGKARSLRPAVLAAADARIGRMAVLR